MREFVRRQFQGNERDRGRKIVLLHEFQHFAEFQKAIAGLSRGSSTMRHPFVSGHNSHTRIRFCSLGLGMHFSRIAKLTKFLPMPSNRPSVGPTHFFHLLSDVDGRRILQRLFLQVSPCAHLSGWFESPKDKISSPNN